MSEFYASSDFLDRKQLFTKYYSLISVITLQASTVDYMANKLRRYSGFGVESQISYLRSYSAKLKDYKEDIRTEYNSLVKIVDSINDSERKAVSILGNISDEYKLGGYDTVGNVEKSTSSTFSELYRKVYDVFTKLGKNTTKIFSTVCDVFKNTPSFMKEVFKDILGPAFNGLDAIGKVMQTIDFFTDGKVSFSDIAGTLSNSSSIIESALKITEAIKGVKFIPNAKVAIDQTVKIGGEYIGKFTQYLPVLNVALTTIFSGAKTYDKVSADGKVDTKDWAEIGIDAGIDGLVVCGEALICIACPPAAIGVAVFEIANLFVGEKTGTSIKDMAKDGWKKGAEFLGNKLAKLMGRAVPA